MASSVARRSSGAGKRFEQDQRRLEPVARRGLLLEIGARDRRIELDDRLPFLDGVAFRDQQLVHVPLDRRREGGDVVGEGLAPPQSLDGLGQRPQPGRLGLHHDVGLAILFVFFHPPGPYRHESHSRRTPPQAGMAACHHRHPATRILMRASW